MLQYQITARFETKMFLPFYFSGRRKFGGIFVFLSQLPTSCSNFDKSASISLSERSTAFELYKGTCIIHKRAAVVPVSSSLLTDSGQVRQVAPPARD